MEGLSTYYDLLGQIEEHIDGGWHVEEVSDLIDRAELPEEHRSALWLYSWAWYATSRMSGWARAFAA